MTTQVAAVAPTWKDAVTHFASALLFPFYLLGFVAGLVVWAVLWAWHSAQVGFGDGRRRR